MHQQCQACILTLAEDASCKLALLGKSVAAVPVLKQGLGCAVDQDALLTGLVTGCLTS